MDPSTPCRPRVLAVGALALAVSTTAAAAPTFSTCDATIDFAIPGATTYTDPGLIDVGMPLAFPPGTVSGNDISDVRFFYEPSNDTLYAAINTYVIAGDVDGDGNPNATGPVLAGLGGVDTVRFGGTESFAIYFDIDQDGQMDVIAGVPSGADTSGFRVTTWSPYGNLYAPSISFGTPLLANTGSLCGTPNFLGPDILFSIPAWSTLPLSSGSDASYNLDFTTFVGSFSDAGIGEDFTPGAGTTFELPVGRCGDGVHAPNEQCDDGNNVNTDGCTNTCTIPVCGDGAVQAGEQCDDGNTSYADACAPTCELPGCTYTIGYWQTHNAYATVPALQEPWPIDEDTLLCGQRWLDLIRTPTAGSTFNLLTRRYIGARLNDAHGAVTPPAIATAFSQAEALLADCTISSGESAQATALAEQLNQFSEGSAGPLHCDETYCGDGRLQAGEQCDDGNGLPDDGCGATCLTERCGDGIIQIHEICDDGNTSNTDACTNTCQAPRCGDGYVQAGEQCDDANSVNTDNCTNTCRNARCGDGFVQPGETCDDGNPSNTDTCTNVCRLATCGDGFTQPGEQCDDGNANNTDACTTTCTAARCGDGHVQPGEKCDDGNANNTDACTNVCDYPRCGDGFVQPGEDCDDGNASNADACTDKCEDARCGDGYVQAGEQCDDGDMDSTDGCTVACFLPSCGDGYLQAGEACDDGNLTAGDGCDVDCETEALCVDPDAIVTSQVRDMATGTAAGRVFSFASLYGGGTINLRLLPSGAGSFVIDWDTETATFTGQAKETSGSLKTWTYSLTYSYRGQGPTADGTSGAQIGVYNPTAAELNAWLYWDLVSGTLTRTDNGDYLRLTAYPSNSSKPMQMGRGANKYNSAYGFAHWVDYDYYRSNGTKVRKGGGDVNADIDYPALPCICGDGQIDPGETCDDGNTNNTDACSNTCEPARCGDGFTQAGEQCDDGNTSNTDACTNTCQTSRCGDGFMQAGEQCDDGNSNNTDTCTNTCQTPRCGDGFTQAGEQCDDGNTVNTDTCTNTCANPRCGDGYMQAGEQCDDGNTVNTDGCSNTCRTPRCGDSIVQPGEQCDDGNTVNTDACSNTCQNSRCGDGIVQAPETCDDGNSVNTDGCTNTCAAPRCGDGYVQAGETCDDGNTSNTDGCTNTCQTPRCGDGYMQAGEACDDGNSNNTDGCTNTCQTPRCGDGYVQAGETCDDGNTSNTDACTNACQAPRCGDGFMQAGEDCDDGNSIDDDGCTNTCTPSDVCVDFGLNTGFNLVAFGDYTGGLDAGGPVAVGGDLSMSDFAINHAVRTGLALAVGGNASLTNGNVFGDGFYGVSGTTNTVGFVGGTFQQGTPFDFAAAEQDAWQLCDQISDQPANGQTIVTRYPGVNLITLRGFAADVNRFDLSGIDAADMAALTIEVPAGSTVIVRVSGVNVELSAFGFSHAGSSAGRTLFTACDATTVTMGSVGFQGSLLAPGADVNFTNGNIDGQMVVWSLSGDGELHHVPFTGDLTCPEGFCGDGLVNPGETCDDGNTTPGDGCSSVCVVEPGCVGPLCGPSVCVDDLGAASRFNVFVATDYTGGLDSEGPVAAGETLSMSDFQVGWGTPGWTAMVSGGTLSATRGSIYGDAWHPGALLTPEPWTINFPAGGSFRSGSVIDFGIAFDELIELSDRYDAESENATALLQWGGLYVTGTSTTRNVVDIDAAELGTLNHIVVDAPAGSKVIVNVHGASASIRYLGMYRTGVGAEDILFNFVDATSLTLDGLAFQGSILAPFADVVANNGQGRGQIVAFSLTGTLEMYWHPFSGVLPCP